MIKRISILVLLLLFFISTTGLPLTIHLCNMNMGNDQADQTCKFNNEMITKVHQSCQQEPAENTYFSMEKGGCCKSGIADKPISDKFLQSEAQKHNLKLNIIPFIGLNLSADNTLKINLFNYFNDSSPPSLINNHIYLNNSILLI